MFKKCKFTSSDDYESYDGYHNETMYNGWDNVILTRVQLTNLLHPYDVRFAEPNTELNDRNYPIAIIYMENETILESSPFSASEGILEGYYFDFEFMVIR